MQFPQGILDVEFEWCPDDEEDDSTIPEPSVASQFLSILIKHSFVLEG